jgi:hypothetical protein
MIKVILDYEGKQYEFDMDLPLNEWIWAEGNFSCDCNKSLFINEYCDANFPEMECGNKIKLVLAKELN